MSSTDEDDPSAESEDATGSVVATLAAELEAGDVREEDVERLRAALGGQEGSGSLVARVEKLQRDVDEVLAYASALEAFLDENGTGEQAIAEFREQVADVRSDVDGFRSELAETQSMASRAETRVETLEADVDDGFDDLESELARVQNEIGTLREEVETLRAWRTQLVSVMSEVEGEVEDDGSGDESEE